MMPQEAMELLSGAYLLRETTAFATVDLLAADLSAGDAVLYKWGAAPSYLRRGTVVRKLGTASPPPGLEAGEACQVEGVRLSFKEGEVLVMLSDGAAGAAAERAVAAYEGEAPGEMAARILAGAAQDAGEADDRTVVTVCLRPCRTGRAATHETADCSA
jgi:stage II sporulation protein E